MTSHLKIIEHKNYFEKGCWKSRSCLMDRHKNVAVKSVNGIPNLDSLYSYSNTDINNDKKKNLHRFTIWFMMITIQFTTLKVKQKLFILQLNLTVPENINTTQIKRKFIVKMFHIFSHYSSLNFCKRNSTYKNISTKINVYHNSKKKTP